MKITIFIFFLFLSLTSWSADEVLNIEYISFGTNFFTPTTYENFHMRVEKKFSLKSKSISKMLSEIGNKCNLKPIENEPRVIFKRNEKILLIINVEKTFVTKTSLCSFDKSLEQKVIQDLEKKASNEK